MSDFKRHFVYGLHAIGAVIDRAPERLLELWMSEPRDDARARDLRERAVAVGVRVQAVGKDSLQKLVGDVAHQGAVAAVRPLKPWDEHDLIRNLGRLRAESAAPPTDASAGRSRGNVTEASRGEAADPSTSEAAGSFRATNAERSRGNVAGASRGEGADRSSADAADSFRATNAERSRGNVAGLSRGEIAVPAADSPLLLVLDGVTDPHNLGACLRTADAAGVFAVVIPKDRSATVDGVVRKVAAGAAEFVPVATVTNMARALDQLKELGIWVVGTDGDAPQTLYQADLRRPLALVLGAEGAGMRRLTRERCDFTVRIPMGGQVESLNVSVAAGVALFEARRQRS